MAISIVYLIWGEDFMLIKCTECNHDVSDKAEKCPNCGCPVEEIKKCIKSKKREQMVNILVSQNLATRQQNKKNMMKNG